MFFCVVVVVEKTMWKKKLFVKWHHFHKDLGRHQHLWSKQTTFIYMFNDHGLHMPLFHPHAASCFIRNPMAQNSAKITGNFDAMVLHVRLEIFRCSRSQQKNKNKYLPRNKYIPPLENSKSFSKVPLGGDRLVPRRVVHNRYFFSPFVPSTASRHIVTNRRGNLCSTWFGHFAAHFMRISSPDSNHSLFSKREAKMRIR